MKRPNYQNKKWLYQKYIIEELSTLEIQRRFGYGKSTIQNWLVKFGIPRRRGAWKKARKPFVMSPHGYKLIYMPDHPTYYKHKRSRQHITPSPYVPEHILVMEKMIGRYLKREEIVHHKNGNRADNKPSNLQLFSSKNTHARHEQLLNSFAKQLLFGKIKTRNRKKLLQLFKTFVNEHGQDIST